MLGRADFPFQELCLILAHGARVGILEKGAGKTFFAVFTGVCISL